MIKKIMSLSLDNRWWVVGVTAFLAALGMAAALRLPIDAVPDITNIQVMVNTKTGSLDPEKIERQVTYRVETELAGLPNVLEIRSISKYGLSQVTVSFHDGTDIYWARQQVAERLQNVRADMPEGLAPELAPITTGLGEVVMYVLRAKPGTALARLPSKERLMRLRTVQDFLVRPELRKVAGIADVDTNGGYPKQIHVNFDPAKLVTAGLTIDQLVDRLETVGESAGGGYIERDGEQIIVRSDGGVKTVEDLANLPLGLNFSGQPRRVKDVARVRVDSILRVGAATAEGEETVLGTALMRIGANSREVSAACVAALKEIAVPEDVELKVLYSRGFLVDTVIKTVATNLVEGALLVIAVLLLLVGDLRAALIVALAIPVSMLFALKGMLWLGLSANLMSLGAVDFGLLVDGSVVLIENVMRRMALARHAAATPAQRRALILEACSEVASPVLFGLLIIMLVYVPILGLQGIEGKMFRPMAATVLLALAGSLFVAFLVTPALAYFGLRPSAHEEKEPMLFRLIQSAYRPSLAWALSRPRLILGLTLALGVSAILIFTRLGADFVPKLDEGDMLINLTRKPGISLAASIREQELSEKVIQRFPEVETVFSRLGTPDSATDPMGVYLADTFVILKKDRGSWPRIEGRRRSKDELFEAIKAAIDKELPGQEISMTQPIEMRFNEILEGSRADVTLRILGPDLETLSDLIVKAREIVEKIPGISEAESDPLTALSRSPILTMELDPAAMARYGVPLKTVNATLTTTMSGRSVGSFYEEDRRYPVIVHLDESLRDDLRQIEKVPVALPEGGSIPLERLARLEKRAQVTTIARNWGKRYSAVSIFLKGRDVAGFVTEAQQAVKEGLKLPPGYTVYWGGQFRNLDQARRRLLVVVPLTLAGVLVLLLMNFGSWSRALIVFSAVPFAMAGGVFALALRGIPMSVSAAVGFIALAGIAILNSTVLVTFFMQLEAGGRNLHQTVYDGALLRLRPVVMTALVASLGFLPMALNTGMGAEVQRPLATVVIGGLASATLLTLIVLPVIYSLFGWTRKESIATASQ